MECLSGRAPCGPLFFGIFPFMAKALCLQSIRSIQWFHVILILGVIFSCRGAWTGGDWDGVFFVCQRRRWMKTCWFQKFEKNTNWIDFTTKKFRVKQIVLELNVSIRELNFCLKIFIHCYSAWAGSNASLFQRMNFAPNGVCFLQYEWVTRYRNPPNDALDEFSDPGIMVVLPRWK